MCLLGRSGLSLSFPLSCPRCIHSKMQVQPLRSFLSLSRPPSSLSLSFILLPFDAPTDATRTLPANLPHDEDESLRGRTPREGGSHISYHTAFLPPFIRTRRAEGHPRCPIALFIPGLLQVGLGLDLLHRSPHTPLCRFGDATKGGGSELGRGEGFDKKER